MREETSFDTFFVSEEFQHAWQEKRSLRKELTLLYKIRKVFITAIDHCQSSSTGCLHFEWIDGSYRPFTWLAFGIKSQRSCQDILSTQKMCKKYFRTEGCVPNDKGFQTHLQNERGFTSDNGTMLFYLNKRDTICCLCVLWSAIEWFLASPQQYSKGSPLLLSKWDIRCLFIQG